MNHHNVTHPKDGRAPTLTSIPKEKDTNSSGDIFGGWILSQMDIAGGARAFKEVGGRVVTVAVDGMSFDKPVFVDDIVFFYTNIERIGTTSITIHVDAWVKRQGEEGLIQVTQGLYTFVALDENKKPTPINKG